MWFQSTPDSGLGAEGSTRGLREGPSRGSQTQLEQQLGERIRWDTRHAVVVVVVVGTGVGVGGFRRERCARSGAAQHTLPF